MSQKQRKRPTCHRCRGEATERAEWVGGWGGLEPLVLHFCATCYREAITGPGEVGAGGGEWPQMVLEIFEASKVRAR